MSDEDTKSWIYAGGLPYELSEGDIVCVFSQYGETLEISLSRDKETGKSRGFCFLKYEDSRSCELAVDNLNGSAIVGRRIKVSFANNVNALKAKKPAVVAPTEMLPVVETNNKDLEYKHSPSPRRHNRSKYSHRESKEKRHKRSHKDSKRSRHKSRHHSRTKSSRRESSKRHSKH